MNKEESQYLEVLEKLLKANPKKDRTGVGTTSIFGTSLRFSLLDGKLPLLTTKKVFYRGAIEETLFFIRGERDTKKLEEKGINIWKGNTSREFLDKRGLSNYEEGDMGLMYGVQWRDFGSNGIKGSGVDQLKEALRLLKDEPESRRIVVTAHNPKEAHLGVLFACHTFFQFNVDGEYLDCMIYLRSNDWFLGAPFNICGYAVLTHIFAKAAGLKARDLVYNVGDTHLYTNHKQAAEEQLKRTPSDFPTLKINKEIATIEDIELLTFDNFEIEGYNPQSSIKADMAV